MRYKGGYVARIISHNLPSVKDEYDPETKLLDLAATYKLCERVLESGDIQQKIKASQMMTLVEMLADRSGINLKQKGHITTIKRSELKNGNYEETMVTWDEVKMYASLKTNKHKKG